MGCVVTVSTYGKTVAEVRQDLQDRVTLMVRGEHSGRPDEARGPSAYEHVITTEWVGSEREGTARARSGRFDTWLSTFDVQLERTLTPGAHDKSQHALMDAISRVCSGLMQRPGQGHAWPGEYGVLVTNADPVEPTKENRIAASVTVTIRHRQPLDLT